MNGIQLLLLSVVIYAFGAVGSLLLAGSPRTARIAAGVFGLGGSLVGIAGAAVSLTAAETPQGALLGAQPFGNIVFRLDPLSAFMVGVITLLGAAASLYSISYMKEYEQKTNVGVVGFFTNLFLAAMLLVVTVANAFYFLVFWEMMTMVSYFLVIFEPTRRESIQAGYLYMLIAHAGTVLIMAAFLVLFQQSGSFDFSAFHRLPLSAGVKSLVFLLAFTGFGAKAGMVPLHIWLPRAHPAAPSHISALMSGVMIKTAVYGILRVGVDFLGADQAWWGYLVMAFGAASAVLGVFYALVEADIKRLLAYSSVENIGIILIGVGTGMVGLAIGSPALAVLGLLAALYHLLNHAFFKGLLFMGAGSVITQAHTQDLNRMGGLARRMPWSALAFLVGALAVSAMPPLSGFASEWLLYQSLLAGAQTAALALRVLAPVCAVLLALAGALAVMVFIKAYGSAFAGPAHSRAAAAAKENGWEMLASMGFLALGTLFLGLGGPWVAPWMAHIAARLADVPAIRVASGWQVFPADPQQAAVSLPLVMLLLLGLLVVPLFLAAIYAGRRLPKRTNVEPWACGYGYKPTMAVSATSFNQPVHNAFQPLYRLRSLTVRPFQAIAAFSQQALGRIRRAEPVIETAVVRPTTRLVETAGQWIQALQMGDIRVYCLYIILTLAILLIVSFGGSGL